MKAEIKICLFTLLLALPMAAGAQKEAPILLVNPSFEDVPRQGESPSGWYNCGFPDETPPDVQPGSFSVSKTPTNGSTYLGLVVRDNETWEGVSQRLSRPLEQNSCYEMSVDLCRSEIYMSVSKITNEPANYTTPCKLRVWGGMGYCDKRELLYESALITHNRWLGYSVRLSPKKASYSYIYFEAYYKTPVPFPYNGHILMDNATAIRPLPCKPEKMDAKPTPPPAIAEKQPAKTPVKTARGGANPTPPPVAQVTKPAVKKIDSKNIRRGDIIRLDKVYFDANQFDIKDECIPALEIVHDFLRTNPNVTIEVGGHTNNKAAEKFALELSTNRAKAVADWLIDKGISANRIQFKGYGWKSPIQPNTTEEGRKKNQRVEIKILNVNG